MENKLSIEQMQYLGGILDENAPQFIIVTGSAGTGKSTLLNEIVDRDPNTIVVTPTGISAILVGGQTGHAFFGLRPDSNMSRMRTEAKQALRNATRLIMDEVSMFRSDFMQLMNDIMQKELGNTLPFGGVKIVAFGDLSQTEPVVKSKDEQKYLIEKYGSHFFFDADCVKNIDDIKIIILETVYRQQGELEYIKALQSIRHGYLDMMHVFNSRVAKPSDDSIRITYTNKRAIEINDVKLSQISSQLYTSKAEVTGEFSESEYPTQENFSFKMDARVMLLINNRDEYNEFVNGDIGTIVGIYKTAIAVKLDRNGQIVTVSKHLWEKKTYTFIPGVGIQSKVVGTFTQLPMRLAWALTTHKCQGQTFHNKVHLELETSSFAHGLLYVALSRPTKLENLTINRKITERDIIIDKRVFEWCTEQGIM